MASYVILACIVQQPMRCTVLCPGGHRALRMNGFDVGPYKPTVLKRSNLLSEGRFVQCGSGKRAAGGGELVWGVDKPLGGPTHGPPVCSPKVHLVNVCVLAHALRFGCALLFWRSGLVPGLLACTFMLKVASGGNWLLRTRGGWRSKGRGRRVTVLWGPRPRSQYPGHCGPQMDTL